MRKWFYAIHLVLNSEKRISACQLQRKLGVLYKTAWRILHLIRGAMGNEETAKAFKCFAEIDGRSTDNVYDQNYTNIAGYEFIREGIIA
jgi:hypothetical protein